MADADISVNDSASAARKVDTRTVGAGTDEHRQVVVVGDPTTAANVQTVNVDGAAFVHMGAEVDAWDGPSPERLIVVGAVNNASGFADPMSIHDATGGLRVYPADPFPVTDNGGSLTVDGTFWQATQPVSGSVSLAAPLPAGTNAIGTTADDWRRNTIPKRYRVTTAAITPGAATVGTNVCGLRKANANADVYIVRLKVSRVHNAAAVGAGQYGWRRAASVAAGSQIAVADLPKFDSAAANATLEVRTGAVTGTKANNYLHVHPGSTTAAPAAATHIGTMDDFEARDRSGAIRLTADEGLILDIYTASDTDDRLTVTVEWEEA